MMLGYHASYSKTFLVMFFKVCFFFAIRPIDPISGNSFDAKRKKKKKKGGGGGGWHKPKHQGPKSTTAAEHFFSPLLSTFLTSCN